jgi:hypothetical protein
MFKPGSITRGTTHFFGEKRQMAAPMFKTAQLREELQPVIKGTTDYFGEKH